MLLREHCNDIQAIRPEARHPAYWRDDFLWGVLACF